MIFNVGEASIEKNHIPTRYNTLVRIGMLGYGRYTNHHVWKSVLLTKTILNPVRHHHHPQTTDFMVKIISTMPRINTMLNAE